MRFDPTPRADPSNAVADDGDAARLGQWLFFDPSLSLDGTIACASCHRPDHGFSDPVPLSTALDQVGRHTQPVWNTANNEWFFWDGRKDTQWSQALAPLEDAKEHGTNRVAVLRAVADQPAVAAAYEDVFGALPDLSAVPDATPLAPEGDPWSDAWAALDEPTRFEIDHAFANIGKAIAAYERQLMTGPTRFDAWADALLDQGAPAAEAVAEPLSAEEQRGLQLFVGEAQCHLCHFGPDLSNEAFHNIGLDGTADNGRFNGVLAVVADPFNAAGVHSDDPAWGADRLARLPSAPPAAETLGQFKVPSLRGVGQSPPYFHDGSHSTLEEVIAYYSRELTEPVVGHREESLVILDLPDDDEAALVAFLRSLDVPPLDPDLLGPPSL
jgi:cytochrome c peroxidase